VPPGPLLRADLVRPLIQHRAELELIDQVDRPLVDEPVHRLLLPDQVLDVLLHREVGEEGAAARDVPDLAVARRQGGDVPASDQDLSRDRWRQPGHRARRRRGGVGAGGHHGEIDFPVRQGDRGPAAAGNSHHQIT
jgi:hypothetical protein